VGAALGSAGAPPTRLRYALSSFWNFCLLASSCAASSSLALLLSASCLVAASRAAVSSVTFAVSSDTLAVRSETLAVSSVTCALASCILLSCCSLSLLRRRAIEPMDLSFLVTSATTQWFVGSVHQSTCSLSLSLSLSLSRNQSNVRCVSA